MSASLPKQTSWSSTTNSTTSSSTKGTTWSASKNKLVYLPDPGVWPVTPVTPRDTLNDSANSAKVAQDTKAAENSPLPIIYGAPRVGAKISNALYVGTTLVLLAVWGHGEVDSFVEVDIDDKPFATGVTTVNYKGGIDNIIDPTLVAAFAAQSPPVTYSDTLPGICYSVVSIPNGTSSGFPRVNAIIKGLKVYDPRSNLLNYSEQFDNVAWAKTSITVSTNSIVAPDGTTTADTISATATLAQVEQTFTGTIGIDYLVSFWIKRKTGVGQIYLRSVENIDIPINITSNWTKVTLSTLSTTTSIRAGITIGVSGDEVYLWGAQLEAGTITKGYTTTTSSPVSAGTRWSDVPALCIGDFISNATYGMNRLVDYASVGDVAFDNSYMVGTFPTQERSRILDLSLETIQTTQAWLDTLRTYASCWIIPSPTGYRLISDKAGTSVASFNHADGKILSISNLKKRGIQSVPTIMTVTYRDTSSKPYKDSPAEVSIAGQRRESSVSLPGVTRYSQAYREAFERLKKLNLNDLSCSLTVFDEGLELDVGDIITVSHPVGLGDKAFRIMGITGEYGRFDLTLVEYDPAVYNNSINIAPTTPDTNLPSPSEPPIITGVSMIEEIFQLENGLTSSRWRITWNCDDYMFLREYRAELWNTTELIHVGSPTTKEWPTPTIQEGVAYTAKIYAISSIGSVGTVGIGTGTALGKQALPGNVSNILAFEAGGRVYASWPAAIDIDIWRYEVRYGAIGTAWASCLVVDRVDALTLTTDLIPVGTWVLKVKAIDSVDNESATEASVTVTVSSDASAFLIDTKLQTNPTLTNMQEYAMERTDPNRYFVTEDNVSFAAKFPNAMSTYGNALATYHNSVTSTWLGEVEDFGLLLGGQWTGTSTVADVSGSHIDYLGNSADNVTWNYPAGLSQKINARFARLKHEALTTSTLKVVIPEQSIRIDAIPREEVGTVTSSAAGAVSVHLVNDYVSVKRITVTPQGTTFASAVVDNIGIAAPSPSDAGPGLVIAGGSVSKTGDEGIWRHVRSKHQLPATGKWYWEIKAISVGAISPRRMMVGFSNVVASTASYAGVDVNGLSYDFRGAWYTGGVGTTWGSPINNNDIIGCCYDAVANSVEFYLNNTSQGVLSLSGVVGPRYFAMSLAQTDQSVSVRTTETEWSYAPPAGYEALPYAFDVHIFDAAGTRISRTAQYAFQGV